MYLNLTWSSLSRQRVWLDITITKLWRYNAQNCKTYLETSHCKVPSLFTHKIVIVGYLYCVFKPKGCIMELNQHWSDKFLLASHLTNLQPSIDPWKHSKFQGAELRQLRSLSLSYIHRQWHSKTKTQKHGCRTRSFNLQARHSPNLLYTYHQVTLLSLLIGPR